MRSLSGSSRCRTAVGSPPSFTAASSPSEIREIEHVLWLVVAHEPLANQIPQCFGRAAAETAVARSAVHPRHEKLIGEAVATEHLDRLAGDADRHLVAEDLGGRCEQRIGNGLAPAQAR